MTLELASIPLAALAGVLGILSPCVWPLVPVVVSTAMGEGGIRGAGFLAAGLATAFAVAGTIVSYVFVETGLDPELVRRLAGAMLVLVAGLLIFDVLAERMTVLGSRLTGWLSTSGATSGATSGGDASSAWGAFSVGSLLGFVWLPCVGPTLGAAIGLASMGQAMPLAFATMVAYGLGTASMLLAVGLASRELLLRARPRIDGPVLWAKRGLGLTMGVLGLLVLTGFDKRLEAWGVGWLPDWTVAL